MNAVKTKKTIQFSLIVLGLIAALIVSSTLLIKPIVEKTLRSEINKLLKNVYTFDFENISINLIAGSITIENIKLLPSENNVHTTFEQENLYAVNIKRAHLNGLAYLPFLKKNLTINEIEILDPIVSISNIKSKQKDSTQKLNFYSLIQNKIKVLAIKYIHISGGRLQLMKPKDKSLVRFAIKNFSAEISNIHIDSAIAAKNGGWPNWEKLNISSVSNRYLLPDKKHLLDIPKLVWSDRDCVLVISNPRFYDREAKQNSGMDIKIKELRGEQIDLKALLKGHIKINNILLTNPTTSIVIKANAPSQKPPNVELILKNNFPQTEISTIQILNGQLSLENKKKKYKVYIQNFNHYYDSIAINTSSNYTNRFARPGIKFEAKNIKVIFPDSLYVFTGEDLKVGKTKNEVTMVNASLSPQYNKKEYFRKRGVQEERIQLTCPILKLQGIDIYDILLEQKIIAKSIEVPKLTLIAYRDKNYPERKILKFLPAVMLMHMDEYIKVDYLHIGNASIFYEEKLPGNKGINKVHFLNLHAKIYNVTNDEIAAVKPMRIVASAYFYGKGYLYANAVFPLRSKHGNFTIDGGSKAFDMNYMNSILESSASLSVKTGTVDSMNFSMQGNDSLAHGNMQMYYHDLKLNVLNRKTSSKHGLKAEIGTFLLDKMLIKSENPGRNEEIRKGEILFKRDPYKSIFSLFAKSLLSGVLSTVAPAVSEIKKMKEP